MYDITALGEILIDFTYQGIGRNGQKLFAQNPGGAPANALTSAARFGAKTAFLGKAGTDMHGRFLKEILEKEQIDTRGFILDERYFTTLAFVEIAESGERQFSFSRKQSADTQLCADELNQKLLEDCKVFHFGSLSLTDEPARTATIEVVKIAKSSGAFIDVMKVSDEELVLLTGNKDYSQAVKILLDIGPKLVAVTLGSEGVLLATKQRQEKLPGFKVKAIDTTGAGDSFWGGF